MDAFLGKITGHAMNYAIRTGIGITANLAIRETSRLLKTVDNNADYGELHKLQEDLNIKIGIITHVIDMVEIIAARGNTTLDSAVKMSKNLRREIQTLGNRLSLAAASEEASKRSKTKAASRAAHELEIRHIINEMKKLIMSITESIPMFNVALAASGAKISSELPLSVSPSRMMQASTFLTAGDNHYCMIPSGSVQVGPTFTLSLYMLFAGHSNRAYIESSAEMTWKEVMHKAKVRLVRIPLECDSDVAVKDSSTGGNARVSSSIENRSRMPGEGRAKEFAYRLEIVEDLDDDRAHFFDDDEAQPGPFGDVRLAGIREFLPVHQISKIFYADTGKILNIGNEGEANSPVLLFKRDVNAVPPRRMMQEHENTDAWQAEEDDGNDEPDDDGQDDIDRQLRRESSVHLAKEAAPGAKTPEPPSTWQLPLDLDPEWLALEVYTEPEPDSPSDDGEEANDDSAYVSHRPSSTSEQAEALLASGLANLSLSPDSSPPPTQLTASFRTAPFSPDQLSSSGQPFDYTPNISPYGPVDTKLSILEMLIRLSSLQEFQQKSHLSIEDELLVFFLHDSSTAGAGGDGEERRRTRRNARQKLGFDPYDESPIKRHGEDYQYQNQSQGWGGGSRGGTPNRHQDQGQGWESDGRGGAPYDYERRESYGYEREYTPRSNRQTPQGSPEPWLMRNREGSAPLGRSPGPSSPLQPMRQPARRPARPLERVMAERGVGKNGSPFHGSPLGRGASADTDSTLGTSPGSPPLINSVEKGDVDPGE